MRPEPKAPYQTVQYRYEHRCTPTVYTFVKLNKTGITFSEK